MKPPRRLPSAKLACARLAGLSLCALGAASCYDAQVHELGFTDPSLLSEAPGTDEMSGEPEPEAPSPTETPMTPFRGLVSDFYGRWVGEAEDPLALDLIANTGDTIPPFRFPSGSTRIALTIEERRFDIEFGDAAPIPPPNDPEVGYPPGVDYWDLFTYSDPTLALFDGKPLFPPFEGFVYQGDKNIPVSSADFSDPEMMTTPDGVLRISFATTQILAGWCSMQASYKVHTGEYSCLPDTGFVRDDSGPCLTGDGVPDPPCNDPNGLCDRLDVPVDCNKALLCAESHCTCDLDGCRLDATPASDRQELILRRTATGLTGSFYNTLFINARGLPVSPGTVRFRPAD